MKKIIRFVVLSLLCCNIGFANTWDIIESKDEFDGTASKYVISNGIEPNQQLSFPYENIQAQFVKWCGQSKAVSIIFNMNPNLIGYQEGLIWKNHIKHDVRIKVDDVILKTSGEIRLNGKEFKIHSMFYPHVDKIINSKIFMIEFEHYAGKRHYVFDLSNFPEC